MSDFGSKPQTAPQTALTGRIAVEGMMMLACDCVGAPSDQPVLFAHGGGQTRHAWGRAIQAVADEGFWGVTIDLRGHGNSAWAADGDYSFVAYARDLKQAIAAMPRAPVVVGASVGGLAALLAVGEFGAEVTGLALIDIVPAAHRDGAERVVSFMRSGLGGFRSVEAAADAVAAYLPDRPRPDNNRGLRKNLRERPDGLLEWHWDPRLVEGDRIPTEEDVARFYRAAASISVPSLLLRGQRSDVVLDDGVAGLLQTNPLFELEEIPDAGHMIAGDRNDHFNAALVRYLRRLCPPTGRVS
jgi:pimeloyl-ACP methyl ester carboxylesterase